MSVHVVPEQSLDPDEAEIFIQLEGFLVDHLRFQGDLVAFVLADHEHDAFRYKFFGYAEAPVFILHR